MKSRFWKSRLPGPFLLSFLLCFALIDYLIYSATKDSPLGWVWQFLELIADILRNLPIAEYISVMTIFLLGSVVLLGIIVLVVSKGSATKAMQAHTEKVVLQDVPEEVDRPSVATVQPVQTRRLAIVGKAREAAPFPTERSENDDSREVSDRSLPKLVEAALVSMRSSFQWELPDLGMTAKMVLLFAGIATLFGLGTTAIVYYLSFGVFETQINKRADVIAMNLSEAVAKQLSENNLVGLRDELAKYAGQEDVAYIFVEDDTGKILSRTVADLPVKDAGSILQPSSKFTHWTPILYKGNPVYETRAGVLGGKLGILHLGIWQDAVENEIHRILWPIVISILVVMLVGVIIFGFAIKGISRLLLQLAQSANRISEGELDAPSWINRRDEIGKLSISLERIRASLMAAKKRLDPTQSSRPKPRAEAAQLSSQNRL